jgi:hypothetical protein
VCRATRGSFDVGVVWKNPQLNMTKKCYQARKIRWGGVELRRGGGTNDFNFQPSMIIK